MGIFDKFFKPEPVADAAIPSDEQAVLLYLEGEDFDRMVQISDKLTEAIEATGTGMFDGNEIGGNQTVLFMYGPDAELLFRSINPILRGDESVHGAKAVIRYGGLGAPQRQVIIGSPDLAH